MRAKRARVSSLHINAHRGPGASGPPPLAPIKRYTPREALGTLLGGISVAGGAFFRRGVAGG